MIPFFRKAPSEPEFPPELLTETVPLGKRGETLACWYLTHRMKLMLVRQNAVVRLSPFNQKVAGEIDLVMKDTDRNELIFVEVRTRDTDSEHFGSPADSVNHAKRLRICHAARLWMKQNHIPDAQPVRFDIVSIVWESGKTPVLEHWPNAFGWTEPNWRK